MNGNVLLDNKHEDTENVSRAKKEYIERLGYIIKGWNSIIKRETLWIEAHEFFTLCILDSWKIGEILILKVKMTLKNERNIVVYLKRSQTFIDDFPDMVRVYF